jgi:cobyrinic acid a,c-diamide synthase
MKRIPRVIIAGMSGDSGKTLVSCGLAAVLKTSSKKVAAFKKGPDYIDPAWLRLSSGSICRNLDTYLMDQDDIISSLLMGGSKADISVIEGNRGLYDGFDAAGTHSTAELAKITQTPVVLVINVTKVTRTVAAIVLGCKMLDKELNLAGVIINKVAGKRHEDVIRVAIENDAGVPVVGAIPMIRGKEIFPSRHLGLVTPEEHETALEAISNAAEQVKKYVDVDRIIEIAEGASDLKDGNLDLFNKYPMKGVRIGYFSDRAFSFYYPENLENLEAEGAEIVKVNSIEDKTLPDIHALYIGGGFPETNIESLTTNIDMMRSLKEAAENGFPIYAECGGLMYLAESMETDGKIYELSGILPLKVKMNRKPQGHGYMEAVVDKQNPYFNEGEIIRGHEFHYSSIEWKSDTLESCLSLNRGSGCYDGRDGLIYKNVFASYMHLHTLSCRSWSKKFVEKAEEYKNRS